MNTITIFIIRIIIGTLSALILSKFFYPGSGVTKIISLALFLVGIAYIMEAWKKRGR
ncbi:MAG: hypothetical protein V1753_05025 [Pseudomonadota bacterium]